VLGYGLCAAAPPGDRGAREGVITASSVPARHWRSDGDDPLPTEPFRAFLSWFMRITCDRCGKDRMFSETHAAQSGMRLRDIIAKLRHDGCGGRAGRVELLIGIEGASSRPLRKIVVLDG
jgi:hypothetical protein